MQGRPRSAEGVSWGWRRPGEDPGWHTAWLAAYATGFDWFAGDVDGQAVPTGAVPACVPSRTTSTDIASKPPLGVLPDGNEVRRRPLIA